MLHDQDFIKIVRVRRRIFVGIFTTALIFAVIFGIKTIYYPKSSIPRFQTAKEVLAGYKKTTIQTSHGNSELLLEIADTPKKRSEGLMFRGALAKNSGMLFIFDKDVQDAFWMKYTTIPLDILFLDAQKRIVDYSTMEPCKEDPCIRYRSKFPYRYAIEINQGIIREKGIAIGDQVIFDL